jgi:hypothetical protein
MRKALLCIEIAHEFAASALIQFCFRKRYVRGLESGVYVCCGGFFADDEYLGVSRCEGQGEEACQEGRSVESTESECHRSTSDTEQLAPSVCFFQVGRGFCVFSEQVFFCCGETAVLQGVFEKSACFVWCFCGEFVVD